MHFTIILTLIILVVLCFVKLKTYYRKCSELYSFLENYPGPPPLSFLGNILSFYPFADIVDILSFHKSRYGNVFKAYFGTKFFGIYCLIISDVKLLEFILKSNKILEKSDGSRYLKNWLGTGLTTSEGEHWARRRKMITPTFHFKILENFVVLFNSNTDVLIENLKPETSKTAVDLHPFITKLTLDVISETALGTSINVQKNSDHFDIVECIHKLSYIANERLISIGSIDVLYLFTQMYREEKKYLQILKQHVDSIILSKKQKHESTSVNTNQTKNKSQLAFLDLLLLSTENGEPLKEKDLRDEVNTFMFGGQDTTASGICFTLFCLANHLLIQKNVLEEIRSILGGDKNKMIDYDDLQKMRYMEMVIKESMRLYPPVMMIGRRVDQDIIYNGTKLPRGLNLILNIYEAHRNSQIYPEPEKFDPNRFLPEKTNEQNPFAYIPFSAGPRNCIGQKFAMLEMKVVISKILLNYELLPTIPQHKLKLESHVALKSKNGVYIQLKERKL